MSYFDPVQGFVEDQNAGNLGVRGLFRAHGSAELNQPWMDAQALTGSNFAVIPNPGYFQVPATGSSGQGSFTGSLPVASTWTGGLLMVTDTVGQFPFLLTGSIAMMSGTLIAVVGTGGAVKTVNGTKLNVGAGGSVGLWSDGKGWLVTAASGTLTLNP